MVTRQFRNAFRRGLLAVVLPALALAGCSGDDEELAYIERPAESIYDEALVELADNGFVEAAALFDEVERQHPYSQWATRAQLMAAFAHYEAANYEDAILALDRFLALHPGNENSAYAYYLRALCYYERITDVERDQRITEEARDALQEVLRRFPNTDYARDAGLKLDLTRDQLAGKEMSIGRWYLRQGHYNAAINRFRAVVERYETTTHVPEALHRLTEAYLAIGLPEEARANAAVLGYNYPGTEWYRDSYALLVDEGVRPPEPRGFFGRLTDAIF
ncbi:MAG: outer membrane protein assembly factor BamD [Inquilinus sp.]|nr:outer membrane protein assembly factor BamD [Inquilinus sp.]